MTISLFFFLTNKSAYDSLEKLIVMKEYVTYYLPEFALFPFIRVVCIYLGVNVLYFWILRLLLSFSTSLSKDVLGSLK